MATDSFYTIKFRRGLAARWTLVNRVLEEGEPGYEIDTGKMKIGDGYKRWSELPYFLPQDTSATTLSAHIDDPTPHVAYDDGPSFALLYQNAKV